jgi:hypothetical protein
MGGKQIVLVLTAGFSVLITGIFWWEAKTKGIFSQRRRGQLPFLVLILRLFQQL